MLVRANRVGQYDNSLRYPGDEFEIAPGTFSQSWMVPLDDEAVAASESIDDAQRDRRVAELEDEIARLQLQLEAIARPTRKAKIKQKDPEDIL